MKNILNKVEYLIQCTKEENVEENVEENGHFLIYSKHLNTE